MIHLVYSHRMPSFHYIIGILSAALPRFLHGRIEFSRRNSCILAKPHHFDFSAAKPLAWLCAFERRSSFCSDTQTIGKTIHHMSHYWLSIRNPGERASRLSQLGVPEDMLHARYVTYSLTKKYSPERLGLGSVMDYYAIYHATCERLRGVHEHGHEHEHNNEISSRDSQHVCLSPSSSDRATRAGTKTLTNLIKW